MDYYDIKNRNKVKFLRSVSIKTSLFLLLSLTLSFLFFNAACQVKKPRLTEELRWNVKSKLDTIELIGCDLCYFSEDTNETKHKEFYCYQGHIYSMRVARTDSADENFVRYNGNLEYQFRRIFDHTFLFIYDYLLEQVYSYQVVSFSQEKEFDKLVLLKPKEERLFSDPNYCHPGGVTASTMEPE